MINRRVAVRAIVTNGEEILCVKLKKFPGTESIEAQDFWCTPGGGVDIGEPLLEALEREMLEETGVIPVIGKLLYVQQFQHNDWEHLEFFFHVTNFDDYNDINLDNTTHGGLEIAEVGFIIPGDKNVMPEFLTYTDISKDVLSDSTKFFNNLN